ncbi:ATP-binding cassette domain-containing protein [Desulfobotulus pelophilus]|uniref:ATP-binding cassette domain-containing protein n=1 Tax=Desulfobotulus pelophilus TaxID=2823377 RepID=UPI0034A4EBAC
MVSPCPHEISGNEKQRVALARALLRKRKLLLLDEFFSALNRAATLSISRFLMEIRGCFPLPSSIPYTKILPHFQTPPAAQVFFQYFSPQTTEA